MIPPPSSATCALHRTESALGTCLRCGSFQCWGCSAQGTQGFCPSCRALVGVTVATPLPFDRENRSGLFAFAWETFKREWRMLTLATLIFFGVLIVVSAVVQVLVLIAVAFLGTRGKDPLLNAGVAVVSGLFLTAVLHNLAQGVLTMGLVRASGDALTGRKIDGAAFFGQLGKLGRYVLTALTGVAAASPVMLTVFVAMAFARMYRLANRPNPYDLSSPLGVAGVIAFCLLALAWAIAMLPLYFATYELALNDRATAWGAIRNAWRVGSGKRLVLFGWSTLAGGTMIAGAAFCGIGLFPGFALAQLVLTGLYLSLRKGVELEG